MKITKVLLCGLRCTGKTTTMWNLQREFNWPIFSSSHYLQDYIRQMGFSREEIKQHHEEITQEIDGRIDHLLESDGSVVIESRGYAKISDSYEGLLKVLLTAGNHCRFERSANREKTTLERATKRVQSTDNSFLDSVKKVYGNVNMYSPKYYDLVIDTSHKTKEEVMWMVARRVKQEKMYRDF